MGIFKKKETLGVLDRSALMHGKTCPGTVTEVQRLPYGGVPMTTDRRYSDTIRYPHRITFTYTAQGMPLTAKYTVDWSQCCPQKGDTLTVYYLPDNPLHFALEDFPLRPVDF